MQGALSRVEQRLIVRDGGFMFTKCANPSCKQRFDYRQGRFYRFHKRPFDDGQPPNTHSVQHFWLCGECCESHNLTYLEGMGVTIQTHFEDVFGPHPPQIIAAA
jgi:hypothetical protein